MTDERAGSRKVLWFQSRNRGSFDFKSRKRANFQTVKAHSQFQSRNRGSFDFKPRGRINKTVSLSSFNLVIEVLLISSGMPNMLTIITWFQSRNRGSFDFKCWIDGDRAFPCLFLFQSRNRGSFDFKSNVDCC